MWWETRRIIVDVSIRQMHKTKIKKNIEYCVNSGVQNTLKQMQS